MLHRVRIVARRARVRVRDVSEKQTAVETLVLPHGCSHRLDDKRPELHVPPEWGFARDSRLQPKQSLPPHAATQNVSTAGSVRLYEIEQPQKPQKAVIFACTASWQSPRLIGHNPIRPATGRDFWGSISSAGLD